MIALLQRVSEARVDIAGETVGAIGPGLLVLVCAEPTDTDAVGLKLLQKILKLRIFGDELPVLRGFRRGVGIIGSVAQSGNGEIVNEIDSDPRRVVEHTSIKALICAPLKVGERVVATAKGLWKTLGAPKSG